MLEKKDFFLILREKEMLGVGFHRRGEASKEFAKGCWTVIGIPHESNRKMTYVALYRIVNPELWQCLAPNCKMLTGRMIKMFASPTGVTDFSNFFSHLALYHLSEVAAEDMTPALAIP